MMGHVAKKDELLRVGRTVVSRRGELGMTQQDLADRARVDLKTVYNLEAGARWPIAKNRAAVSAALGWAPDTLAAIRAGGTPFPVVAAVPDRNPGVSFRDLMSRILTDDLERLIAGTVTMTEDQRVAEILDLRAKRAELRADLRATQEENDLGIGLARPPRLI